MTKRQIQNYQKLVEKELDKMYFGGWRGDNEFLKMPWIEFLNMCSGNIIIGIGSGTGFRDEVYNSLNMAIAWGKYLDAKTELERKFGIDNLSSRC